MSTPVRAVLVLAMAAAAVAAYVVLTSTSSSDDLSVADVERPEVEELSGAGAPHVPALTEDDVVDLGEVIADNVTFDIAVEDAAPVELPTIGAVVQSTNWMADQLALGALTEQDVLTFAEDVLGYLDGVEPTIRDNGSAEYKLIENDACTVKLTAKAEGSKASEFKLSVLANTQAGRITGLPDDGTERTRLEMTFNPNSETPNVATLANAEYKYTRAFLETVGTEPVRYGGMLSIREHEADARQMTIQRSEVDEGQDAGILHTFTDPEPAAGSLGNPRFSSLFARLERSKPR